MHITRVLLPALLLWLGLVTCACALTLEGHYTQGGLVYGQTEAKEILLDGKALHLNSTGKFIFGFGRDADLKHRLTLVHKDGSRETRLFNIRKRDYRIERINGISKKMMQPDSDDLKRIRAEAGQVAEVRQRNSDLSFFRQNFIWPLHGRISGVYGSQRIFNGEPRRPHYGIDIASPRGSTVVAPVGGIVTLAHPGMFFSGKTMIIDHGHGLSSTFLHLESTLVKVGDQVEQGQKIATVGSSGRSTGPHLDWRVNWFSERLDPALLVPPMP